MRKITSEKKRLTCHYLSTRFYLKAFQRLKVLLKKIIPRVGEREGNGKINMKSDSKCEKEKTKTNGTKCNNDPQKSK